MLRGIALLTAFLLLGMVSPHQVRADEGWVINSFNVEIVVQNDGSLVIREALAVDFRTLQKHGIFRDIPVVYRYDDDYDRVYTLTVQSVTDAGSRAYQYETMREGGFFRIKIGDPDTTLTGPQTYIITYNVEGALNGFPDHDELYWNAMGTWPVATEAVRVMVELARPGIQRIACFQGPEGSREPCAGTNTQENAEFTSTRRLPEDNQLTVVVGFQKGLVPEPAPRLERRAREFEEFFEATPATVGGGLVIFLGVLGALLRTWWTEGRDRRYVTTYYLTDDPREETKPLFSRDPIVIEYTPPEQLRPAQMGLLLDERADPLDATATILDLAVRGYLRIEEVEESRFGIFKSRDWIFIDEAKAQDDLMSYERDLLKGLFQDGSPAKLSDLKTKFHTYLDEAQESLYIDARQRKYFADRPDRARTTWIYVGLGGLVLGAVLTFLLGVTFGAGIVGLPVVIGGLLTMGMAGKMPRRTALGRELLRRTLGFRQYVATAEKERQRYNENANIFATYLPYAIVFGCVDKWAKALESLGATEEQFHSWYVGTTPLRATAFSQNLQTLSSEVSSIIVSTPGGSGGSGFGGGGFSGGGGGGGGGGSW